MSSFIIVLLLVSFQVFCDGTPGRARVPLRRLSDYVPLFKEYRVEKRTGSYWLLWPFCGYTFLIIKKVKFYFCSKVDEYACLRAHNAKRALHADTSPLVWDAKLAQDARAWADHLVRLGKLEHSSVAGQGENLYASWSTAPTAATCKQAVEAW